MTAIFKRDFKSYFHSFIGCLFIGAVLFITGIYVTVYNLLSGLPNLSYAISGVLFLFIISIPILTMRVLAEERRQKTDQLILTAPVTAGQAVAGKFLALGAVFSLPVLVICAYPLILSLFGTVSMLESYVAILAFYLYGLSCIAIGIFISSLTESQVIAAVISFAILFLSYIMAGICNMISTSGNFLTKLLSAFDMVSRFDDMAGGTFDLKAVLYYISVTALFLFFTVQSIQKRRYSVSVKKLRMGAYSSTLTVLMLAVTVLINLFAAEIPSRYTTFDVTSNRLYSLTDETREMVRELTEDIQIYVLSSEAAQDVTLKKTLAQYEQLSDHITVTCVDPVANPKFHTQYTDSQVTGNSLIIVSDKRSRVIDYSTVYETAVDYSTYSTSVTGYDAEGRISSALDYVTRDDMPKMYLLEGHGELTFEKPFFDTIEKANMEYETISLLKYDAVPEDAACIVINAPTSDFSKDDAQKVLSYLENGGNALIISTWTDKDMSNFNRILSFYEISVADGMVLEGDTNSYYQSPFYLLPSVEYDTVTEAVNGSYIFAPYAQGMLLPEEPSEGIYLTPLLTTSSEAYARADISASDDYVRKEEDASGPFTLGVRAVKTEGEKESTALIYSSESLFTNDADRMVSGANMQLFSSSLSALSGDTGMDKTAIPVKSYETAYLTIPQSSILLLGLLITVILPFAVLIAGFIVWFRRRKA